MCGRCSSLNRMWVDMRLSINNLGKRINKRDILSDISFSVSSGEVLAIRGANGSGKTSLLKIISGIDRKYTGEVILSGAEKCIIGYAPQEITLFQELTVEDNFRIFAEAGTDPKELKDRIGLFGRYFDLSGIMKKRISHLSGGNKRLINTLAGMLNASDILLLDEPAANIDEVGYNGLIALINDIKSDKLLLLTSHQEELLTQTCSSYIILSGGKISGEGRYA